MPVKVKGGIKLHPSKVRKFKQIIPGIIANEAKNHFLEGFRKGGGQTDKSASGWKQIKKKRRKTKKKRAILVDTGQLRNDIDTRKTSFRQIIIGTNDTSYGIYHNTGNTRDGVQREFLGDSRKLDRKIKKTIKTELNILFGKK